MYLDTEDSYRAERCAEIAARFGLDGDAVNSNIVHARLQTVDDWDSILVLAAGALAEESFSAIIVDSIMNLHRFEYIGRGARRRSQPTAAPPRRRRRPRRAASRRLAPSAASRPPRQASLGAAAAPRAGAQAAQAARRDLQRRRLHDEPVCADPGGSVFVQDAKKAVGGHVLAHLVDTRVSIRKGRASSASPRCSSTPSRARPRRRSRSRRRHRRRQGLRASRQDPHTRSSTHDQ